MDVKEGSQDDFAGDQLPWYCTSCCVGLTMVLSGTADTDAVGIGAIACVVSTVMVGGVGFGRSGLVPVGG